MKKWLFSLFLMLFAVMMYIPTAQAAQKEDDAFSRKEFQTLYSNGELKAESTDITVDTKTCEDGIIVSGKNSVLSSEKISMGTYEFGTDQLQRIQLDALAEEGKRIKVLIYLDDDADPSATITLLNQTVENSWTKEKNINVDVSDVHIKGTHEVKLAVCQFNKDGSVKESGSAKALLRKIQFVKQTVPVVSFDIDESLGTIEAMNSDADHNRKCYGDVTISVPETFEDTYDTSYTGGTYEMEYIKGRGNSTWTQEKKPYKIKLENSADLFGMGKDKNWVLIANAMDESLLHNKLTYAIGDDLGLTFNPQAVSVDVMMNGQYIGNYLLCENIRVDEQRVNIDPDTDFLLGAGSWGADDGAYVFETDLDVEYNVTSPDASSDNYSEKSAEIEAYMQRVENALLRKENPDTGKVEDPFDLIDLDSAVSYYLVQEMSMNNDFYETGSTYCYKKNDGKLYWGPLWDFDIAWSFGTEYQGESEWKCQRKWFALMLSFPEFADRVETYWKDSLYPEMQYVIEDGGMIDQYKEELSYSAANNYTNTDYEDYYTQYKDCASDADVSVSDDAPYKTTVAAQEQFCSDADQFKAKIKKRVEWMNQNIDSISVPNVEVTFVSEGKVYAQETAYAGFYFSNMPKNPTCSDKNKTFDGWYYTATDEEDGDTFSDEYIYLEDSLNDYCEVKDGKRTITLTAHFKKEKNTSNDGDIYFEKDSYRLALNLSNPTEYLIPFFADVDNTDDIKWEIEDKSIISAEEDYSGFFELDGLIVKAKAAGETKITLTTNTGKKYSVTITVVDNIPQAQLGKYAITDFSLSSSELTVACDSISNLSINVNEPENYIDIPDKTGKGFEWYSSDLDIVSTNGNAIYGESVGTATILCRNTYTGSVKYCKVTVTPKTAKISKTTAGKKKLTVKMSTKPSSKYGSTYQVAYRLKGSSKWHYKTTTKQSVTLKKLKSKKKYYVRVRAYKKVSGKKYYGSWSTKKLVKVK